MTKEFTAKQMNLAPAKVFRAADKEGEAHITHTHYPDKVFVLTTREVEEVKDED